MGGNKVVTGYFYYCSEIPITKQNLFEIDVGNVLPRHTCSYHTLKYDMIGTSRVKTGVSWTRGINMNRIEVALVR